MVIDKVKELCGWKVVRDIYGSLPDRREDFGQTREVQRTVQRTSISIIVPSARPFDLTVKEACQSPESAPA